MTRPSATTEYNPDYVSNTPREDRFGRPLMTIEQAKAATGHMPFPGHRNVAEVRRDEEGESARLVALAQAERKSALAPVEPRNANVINPRHQSGPLETHTEWGLELRDRMER